MDCASGDTFTVEGAKLLSMVIQKNYFDLLNDDKNESVRFLVMPHTTSVYEYNIGS